MQSCKVFECVDKSQSRARALTRTVLSQPAVAKRATGCTGGLLDTRDPGGAAGDQDTAVQPTLCASTCKITTLLSKQCYGRLRNQDMLHEVSGSA